MASAEEVGDLMNVGAEDICVYMGVSGSGSEGVEVGGFA